MDVEIMLFACPIHVAFCECCEHYHLSLLHNHAIIEITSKINPWEIQFIVSFTYLPSLKFFTFIISFRVFIYTFCNLENSEILS